MKQNYKILIVILLIILIPTLYYTITTTLNHMEEESFYNTIKNVSDLENVTDKPISEIINVGKKNLTEILQAEEANSRTLNQSIDTLQELNKSIRNETMKEYINLEVKRMQDEVLYTNKMIDFYGGSQKYKSGEISYTDMISKQREFISISDEYANRVDDDKHVVEDFLRDHPDMKTRFEELNIDEDFMICERGDRNI